MDDKLKKVTIHDVARLAGVSIGTVSRVTKGNATVGADVRANVLRAIADLGYAPSAAAQSMRSRSTMTIGCILREINIPPLAEFFRSAQRVLDEAGYTLLLGNSEGRAEHEVELLQKLKGRQIDGMMIGSYAEKGSAFDQILHDLKVPVVVVDRDEPAWADAVMIDHAHGTRLAAAHLIGLGHRRIALITGPAQLLPARERIKGYLAAFEDAGLEADRRMIFTGSFLPTAGYQVTSSILGGKTPPTAIIAGGIGMLPGVVRAIRVRGLRIPQDISVVGTGKSELAEFHTPPISVQLWDHGEMGRVAANLLLDRILMRVQPDPQHVLLPISFVPQDSTGPVPAAS